MDEPREEAPGEEQDAPSQDIRRAGAGRPHPFTPGKGWLCLSRAVGEGVVITTPEGRRIEMYVSEFRAWTDPETGRTYRRATIAFRAEREVKIMREEIQHQEGA